MIQEFSQFSLRNRELLTLFDGFLTALCDPEGGEVFYRMHASDAPVPDADGIRPAEAVDRDRFARAHREISLLGVGVLPRFSHPAIVRAPEGFGTDEFVAWFEVAEAHAQRNLVVALGLRHQADMLRVGWVTLAQRVEPWSYREGLLQSLADYPWMRSSASGSARALLDASYFRQQWRAPVRFNTLPDARFSCQMSTACCKHDFEIFLPADAQLVIDAMPWSTLCPALSGTRLPVRPDGKLQLKEINDSCRFLGKHNQCLVHQTLGRQPFGPCSVFPFAFAQTPDGIAVALSSICGSARLGLGADLRNFEAGLRERLVQAAPRQPDGFRLAPQIEVSWESFRSIEKSLCDCLALGALPLRRRLYVGSRLLGALRCNEPLEMNRWLTEPQVEITTELREAIRGMLAKILSWERAVLRSLPPVAPPELFRLEVQEPRIVARILQNVLFSKVYSYPFDLTTAYNFAIILYLLTLVMQAASSGPLSDAMWRELGSLGVHGLLKSVLHEGVPEGFRALLGSTEFGQWSLAA